MVPVQRFSSVDLHCVRYGLCPLLLFGVRLRLLVDELMRNELHATVKIREPKKMVTHRRSVVVPNHLASCERLGGACPIVREITG